MHYINFNKNYNGKLFNEFFTTIRCKDIVKEKDLKLGDIVELRFNHIPFAEAEIDEMASVELKDAHRSIIIRTILSVDTGYDWTLAYNAIRRMCGDDLVVILLRIINRK